MANEPTDVIRPTKLTEPSGPPVATGPRLAGGPIELPALVGPPVATELSLAGGPTELAIVCAGLTKRYGTVTAVDRVDLAVSVGEVFGFLGPNGSGKTTTLRVLAGLVRATSGRAWILGRDLPDPRLSVGAMIEEPAFYPWLTGRANLEVLALTGPPPAARGRSDHTAANGVLDREGLVDPADRKTKRAQGLRQGLAVAAVLDRVGLTEAADRKVKAYSQGMRQRLGLAAALLRDPDVLLLDEPTNGLDPAGIRDIRALFRALAAEGRTVFLSSHLLSEVERVCDRVVVALLALATPPAFGKWTPAAWVEAWMGFPPGQRSISTLPTNFWSRFTGSGTLPGHTLGLAGMIGSIAVLAALSWQLFRRMDVV